jgi:hypothetical protein
LTHLRRFPTLPGIAPSIGQSRSSICQCGRTMPRTTRNDQYGVKDCVWGSGGGGREQLLSSTTTTSSSSGQQPPCSYLDAANIVAADRNGS